MRAFTLLEILVTLFIMTLITAGIYGVLSTGDITFTRDVAQLDLQQQARLGMTRMVKELRGATAINNISSDYGTINFTTQTAGNIRYYRDTVNRTLIRQFPANTTTVWGMQLNSLTFCCWHDSNSTCDRGCALGSTNLVEINMTTSNVLRGTGTLTFHLKGQARLRNE